MIKPLYSYSVAVFLFLPYEKLIPHYNNTSLLSVKNKRTNNF